MFRGFRVTDETKRQVAAISEKPAGPRLASSKRRRAGGHRRGSRLAGRRSDPLTGRQDPIEFAFRRTHTPARDDRDSHHRSGSGAPPGAAALF